MKKLALVLFVLLAIQTWGVVGAARTQGLKYECSVQVGPLCYWWEESTLGKLISEDKMDDIEDAMEDARAAWRKDVAEKLSKKDVKYVLENISEMAKDGADNAKRLIEEKVK